MLMFLTTWRTIQVRVRPNDYLVFQDNDEEHPRSSSWREGSLLAWADKGEWSVKKIPNDKRLESEWTWFQIGFEPMFADYTRSGTLFVVVSLAEVW